MNPTDERIDFEEAIGVIAKILNGELQICCKPGYRWETAEGICWFAAGDYEIAIFRDAGELDYVEEINNKDGRWATDEVWGYDRDPLDGLTTEQVKQLDRILREAN